MPLPALDWEFCALDDARILTPRYGTDGPLTEPDVQPVHRGHTGEDLVAFGIDVQGRIPARVATWHIQPRVTIAGDKAIIFA